mgnify:CR=1 FL=1
MNFIFFALLILVPIVLISVLTYVAVVRRVLWPLLFIVMFVLGIAYLWNGGYTKMIVKSYPPGTGRYYPQEGGWQEHDKKREGEASEAKGAEHGEDERGETREEDEKTTEKENGRESN